MSLPDSVSTVTVTETFVDAEGQPLDGVAAFSPSVQVAVEGTTITIEPVLADVTNGVLSVELAATDDPQLSPVGWTYLVQILVGRTRRSYNVSLPASLGTAVLHTLSPTEAVTPVAARVLTVAGVSPTALGDIPLASLPAGPPGAAGTNGTDGAQGPQGPAGPTTPVVVRQAYVTSGDVNPLPNTAAAWLPLSGFVLAIPAIVGDYVELTVNALRNFGGGAAMLDQGVLVGSSVTRYLSSGGAVPALEGDPGWYLATNYASKSGVRGFTVTPGDLDGANVRFCIAVKSNGSGILNASTNYPFYWQAKNYGPVS